MPKSTLKLIAVAALAALATALTLTATSGAKDDNRTKSEKRGKVRGKMLHTKLSGAAEVPGPGDPDGRGNAHIRLLPRFDSVCFRLKWRNIGDPTAAHIHRGAKGVAGPVVVPLFVDSNARRRGCVTGVSDELSQEIRRNPRGFYVNVHNSEFPMGAIRGQLKRGGHHRGHGRRHGKQGRRERAQARRDRR